MAGTDPKTWKTDQPNGRGHAPRPFGYLRIAGGSVIRHRRHSPDRVQLCPNRSQLAAVRTGPNRSASSAAALPRSSLMTRTLPGVSVWKPIAEGVMVCPMTNHKPVTPAEHAAEAVAHLEAAKVFRLQLLDTYDIAELDQAIDFGLKLAEVHALLALVPQTPMRDQRQRSTKDRVFVDGVTL